MMSEIIASRSGLRSNIAYCMLSEQNEDEVEVFEKDI